MFLFQNRVHLRGFPIPEQGSKLKTPVARTRLIKAESLSPPPGGPFHSVENNRESRRT